MDLTKDELAVAFTAVALAAFLVLRFMGFMRESRKRTSEERRITEDSGDEDS